MQELHARPVHQDDAPVGERDRPGRCGVGGRRQRDQVLVLIADKPAGNAAEVAGWGIETRGRTLEDVAADAARLPLPLAPDVTAG